MGQWNYLDYEMFVKETRFYAFSYESLFKKMQFIFKKYTHNIRESQLIQYENDVFKFLTIDHIKFFNPKF